jgi:hypothetical protein
VLRLYSCQENFVEKKLPILLSYFINFLNLGMRSLPNNSKIKLKGQGQVLIADKNAVLALPVKYRAKYVQKILKF